MKYGKYFKGSSLINFKHFLVGCRTAAGGHKCTSPKKGTFPVPVFLWHECSGFHQAKITTQRESFKGLVLSELV